MQGRKVPRNQRRTQHKKRRTGFAYRKLVTNQSPKDPCCGRRSGDRGPPGWSAGGPGVGRPLGVHCVSAERSRRANGSHRRPATLQNQKNNPAQTPWPRGAAHPRKRRPQFGRFLKAGQKTNNRQITFMQFWTVFDFFSVVSRRPLWGCTTESGRGLFFARVVYT